MGMTFSLSSHAPSLEGPSLSLSHYCYYYYDDDDHHHTFSYKSLLLFINNSSFYLFVNLS